MAEKSKADERARKALPFLRQHQQHFIVGVNGEGELDAYVGLEPGDKIIVVWTKKGSTVAKTAALGIGSDREMFSDLARVAVNGVGGLIGLPGVNGIPPMPKEES